MTSRQFLAGLALLLAAGFVLLVGMVAMVPIQ